MKTSIKHIVLILMLSMSLFNCSKDDDDTIQQMASVQDLLIGKWFFSESDGEPVSYCTSQSFYQFLDASNMVILDQSIASSSDPEECTSLFGEEELNYTLENDNKTLTFSSDFGTYSRTIVSISDRHLLLNFGSEIEPRLVTMTK